MSIYKIFYFRPKDILYLFIDYKIKFMFYFIYSYFSLYRISLFRNDKIRKNCTINKDQRTKRKNRSPKEETTSQIIESSCNRIVLNANKVDTEPTKTETTINEKSGLNSTNWNYDELNELKMKFISLLSSSNSAMLSEQQQQQQTPTSQQINILLNVMIILIEICYEF